LGLKAQVGHAGGGVGAVAAETGVGHDGADVAIEADRLLRGGREGEADYDEKAAHATRIFHLRVGSRQL
jgi:hypothetical protein